MYPDTGLNRVLNDALGIDYKGFNPYLSIVCLDADRQEPLPDEQPYTRVENGRHLKKLQSDQLHQDRLLEND